MRIINATVVRFVRRTARSVVEFGSVVRNSRVTLQVFSLERLRTKPQSHLKQVTNDHDYFACVRCVGLVEFSHREMAGFRAS